MIDQSRLCWHDSVYNNLDRRIKNWYLNSIALQTSAKILRFVRLSVREQDRIDLSSVSRFSHISLRHDRSRRAIVAFECRLISFHQRRLASWLGALKYFAHLWGRKSWFSSFTPGTFDRAVIDLFLNERGRKFSTRINFKRYIASSCIADNVSAKPGPHNVFKSKQIDI